MQLISSDTNVWIDFSVIDRVELPFKLPYTYIMYVEAIKNEILYPQNISLGSKLDALVGVELDIEEFTLAEHYGDIYPKLSIYDRIALAIAKHRNIELLTGDLQLRNAAKSENVSVFGTLGVLYRAYEGKLITKSEHTYCLEAFLNDQTGKIRLPKDRISLLLAELNKNEIIEYPIIKQEFLQY